MRNRRLQLTAAILLLCALAISVSACQPKAATTALNLWDIGPITLDPAKSGDMASHSYIMQIFSGLVRLDDKLKPAPDIATSWQESQDGKTYTFFLRKGVKFHDGREVKAQDFKYSWERACSPQTQSQTASIYLSDIVGVKEVLEGKRREIQGIKVIDDYTLEVTIDAPKAYFLSKLTYPTAFVVDRANVESGEAWWRKPNGTGPFKLKEWQPDSKLILEANIQFYRQPPRINQVIFHLWGGMPMAMYEMGEIDAAPVYQYYIEAVRDQRGPFYKELTITPELSFVYIGFNTAKPPFDDVNIRRAFCLAIDKQRIIDVILKGMVDKAEGILPPGMPGYNENLRGLEYDVTEARRLISVSKYGNVASLPPITITDSGYGGNISESLGAIIQQWQENLGVEVTVRQLEPENFLYYLKEEKDELFIMGWVADYPDPQNFLDNLFYTDSEYNYSEYRNTEFDALLARAAVEANEATRMNMYQQAEEILVDEAPCLPLWFNVNYTLVKPYVKGYKLNPLGIADYSQVYIEQ